MSNPSNALDLLFSDQYDSPEEIWQDELGTTVRQEGLTTIIDYTRLIALPTYYEGLPEGNQNVFIQITSADPTWSRIQYALGEDPNQSNDYENFYTQIANIDFNQITLYPVSTSWTDSGLLLR